MANETELSNISHVTDELSDAVSAALVQSVTAAPLIHMEPLPTDSNVKLFRKDGSLVAEGLAESGAYTFSASSELTQSEITATATKFVVATKLTVEAQQFSRISPAEIAMKQGQALARDLDDEILALFSGFSNQVTATTTLTVNDALDAAYTVYNATAGVGAVQLRAVLDYKGVNELKKDIVSSSAPVWSNDTMISLLRGAPGTNNFVGTLPGIDIYQSNGLPTGSGDDIALVFDPALAMAGMASPTVNTRITFVGSGGFWDEVASWVFADFVEWNDEGGAGLLSDT